MSKLAAGLKEKLLSLLYPARCLNCGKVVPQGGLFCPACKRVAPERPYLRRFSLPGAGAEGFMILAPMSYVGGFRTTLHEFKFRGRKALAFPIGRLMAQTAAAAGDRFDAVVWTPMEKRKRRKRGYDQSELLAKAVAEELALPCLPLLEKVRDTGVQHMLSRRERESNVKGAYRAGNSAAGKALLLVDDIVTTGATLTECAKALYAAGAIKVTGLCAADSPAAGTPAVGTREGTER